MAYKISDTAIIVESNGETVLIAESMQFDNTITILDSDFSLSPGYIESVFPPSVPPYVFQGSTSGYNAGGNFPQKDNIDKFSFASDANATDVGDLTYKKSGTAGHSSSSHGYASGGTEGPASSPVYPGPTTMSLVDKYPFASDANATSLCNLYARMTDIGGSGVSSSTHGYTTGGRNLGPTPYIPVQPEQTSTEAYANATNIIQKFPYAGDADGTNVGDLTEGKRYVTNQSSTTHGYISGGSPSIEAIEKFPFSSDTNSTNVGNLLSTTWDGYGQSSTTHGYNSGGNFSPPFSRLNIIQKFPFSSDTNATDVGDLTQARDEGASQSSTANGYCSGGRDPGYNNIIDKFPFSSDTNATDVGDLTTTNASMAGANGR